jgi:chemotaxis protein MotB
MSQKDLAPIIVKRARKGGHGHHGGAWKVAYADFVTAMMAFFLLLWLLNAATKEQLRGISDYFAPVSSRSTTSGGGGLLAGRTIAKNGVFQDETPRSPEDPRIADPSHSNGSIGYEEEDVLQDIPDAELEEYLRQREEQQFQRAEQQIREAIAATPDLSGLAKSLIIDNTPEGLRIQIIDQEGLPMFPRGEHDMYAHTRQVLELVAQVVQKLPQDVAISGHTDATRYQGGAGYSNWELSADRANAARRALVQFGVPESRIARVMGKAANEPLIQTDPEAPGNRRLSVVLLRGTGARGQ